MDQTTVKLEQLNYNMSRGYESDCGKILTEDKIIF